MAAVTISSDFGENKVCYCFHCFPIYLPWCWEGLGAGAEGDDRGWDGWMASLTWWTWVWVNSRSWWWTGRPGMLRFMGSQRVGHDWATELNWTELMGPDALIWVFLRLSFVMVVLMCILITSESGHFFHLSIAIFFWRINISYQFPFFY